MYIIKGDNSTKIISKVNEGGRYELRELHLPGIPNACLELGKDDKVKVSIYGIEMEVTAEWLYCFGKLKIRFTPEYQKYVKDLILFIPNNKGDTHYANTSPKAYFKHPIELKVIQPWTKELETFRLLPYAPNYAISKDGYTLNLVNHRLNAPTILPGENKYVKYELNGLPFRHHVLVASAWCDNPDPQNCIVVDHINGMKSNNHASNLRWVTHKENANNYTAAGKPSNAKPCVVKNLTTGEIKMYASLTMATSDMGRGVINSKNVNLAIGKPYIIKHNGMWFQLQYEGPELIWLDPKEAMLAYNTVSKDRYTLTIQSRKNKDEIYTYGTLEEISEFINNGVKYISLNEAIKYLDSLNKYIITKQTIKNSSKVFYIAYNIETKEVIYANSTAPLVIQTGIPKSSIRKSAYYNGKYMFNNWVFKIDNGDDFTPYETPSNIRMKIIADNGVEKLEFSSMREASRHFNTSLSMVRYNLDKGLPLFGYKLSLEN